MYYNLPCIDFQGPSGFPGDPGPPGEPGQGVSSEMPLANDVMVV